MSKHKEIILSWAIFILFLVAIGLFFGAEAAHDIIVSYGQLIVGLLIIAGVLFSIHLVFDFVERKSGEKTALSAMKIYIKIGLPLVILLLSYILTPIFRSTESLNEDLDIDEHPAYKFYQIAKNGPTTLSVCESMGGIELHSNEYKIIDNIDQGMFRLRETSTGIKYIGVSFAEGKYIVTIRTCGWEEEP